MGEPISYTPPDETKPSSAKPVLPDNLMSGTRPSAVSTESEFDTPPPPPPLEKPQAPLIAEGDLTVEGLQKTLGMDWSAIVRLGRIVNELSGGHYQETDVQEILPPSSSYPILPALASSILHQRNYEVAVIRPTTAQMDQVKPWLLQMNALVGRVSAESAEKLESLIQKVGPEVIEDMAKQIADFARLVEKVKSPKSQFTNEILYLYNRLQNPSSPEDFGGQGTKVEDRIYGLLSMIKKLGETQQWPENTPRWLSERNFPILHQLLPNMKISQSPDQLKRASLAGLEIMKGIEQFLADLGLTARPVDITNTVVGEASLRGGMRLVGNILEGKRLNQVKEQLPALLKNTYDFLPHSGPRFSAAIFQLAEHVHTLSEQGMDVQQIARKIFGTPSHS